MINLTPFLKLYTTFRVHRLHHQNWKICQEQQLRMLLRKAKNTTFGREHEFSRFQTVNDYHSRVPLRRYEDFWNTYWKPLFPILENCSWPGRIPFFAETSGTTTGRTKYIPCSWEMIHSNAKAGLDIFVHHLAGYSKSRVFAGKCFFLGGSTNLRELSPGVFSGDLSGITSCTLPWWSRTKYFPPKEIALIQNWETKINVIAELIQREDIRMVSGIPSWLLLFFERLLSKVDKNKPTRGQLFPKLELLIHGGVKFEPYQRQFQTLFKGRNIKFLEVYPTSEGFVASADRHNEPALRLLLDHGIFFEFVPRNEIEKPQPTRHWIANVEPNVDYAVVLTTCAGLWSYVLGDTVKFVTLAPPRVVITGRISYSLSIFGEHLIGEEIETAVAIASQSIGFSVRDFSVGAAFPEHGQGLGSHLFIVEFLEGIPPPIEVAKFESILDETLCKQNEDYRVHRGKTEDLDSGFGIQAPKAIFVPKGTFADWMKNRSQLGGQHKVPRMIHDQELFKNLQSFAKGLTPKKSYKISYPSVSIY